MRVALAPGVEFVKNWSKGGDWMSVPGQTGSGDEGTAMLEIIHDLAPGANLFFATAFTSQASFAANIVALQCVE